MHVSDFPHFPLLYLLCQGRCPRKNSAGGAPLSSWCHTLLFNNCDVIEASRFTHLQQENLACLAGGAAIHGHSRLQVRPMPEESHVPEETSSPVPGLMSTIKQHTRLESFLTNLIKFVRTGADTDVVTKGADHAAGLGT